MILFKNEANKIKRIGKNICIYALILYGVNCILAIFLHDSLRKIIPVTSLLSVALIAIGIVVIIIGSVVGTVKQDKKQKAFRQKIAEEKMQKQEYDKLLKRSILLFSVRDEFVDNHDFVHWSTTAFYLSPNIEIIKKVQGGMYDGYSSRGMNSSGDIIKISFEELNEYIDSTTDENAQKYKGISIKNCEKMIAGLRYNLDEIDYEPDSAEKYFYAQQKEMLNSDSLFVDIRPGSSHLEPYAEFSKNSKELFVLEIECYESRHYISFYYPDGQLYEVYSRTVGHSGSSFACEPINIFDTEQAKSIRKIDVNELKHLLWKYDVAVQLLYKEDRCLGTKKDTKLEFTEHGDILITDEAWWPASQGASNGGLLKKEYDKDSFVDKSFDDFIAFLSQNYRDDFSSLKENDRIRLIFENVLSIATSETHNTPLYNIKSSVRIIEDSDVGYADFYLDLCEDGSNFIIRKTVVYLNTGEKAVCREILVPASLDTPEKVVKFIAFSISSFRWCKISDTYMLRKKDLLEFIQKGILKFNNQN